MKKNMWGCNEPCSAREIKGKRMMVGSRVKLEHDSIIKFGTVTQTGCSYGHFPTIQWDDGAIEYECTFVRYLEIITPLKLIK